MHVTCAAMMSFLIPALVLLGILGAGTYTLIRWRLDVAAERAKWAILAGVPSVSVKTSAPAEQIRQAVDKAVLAFGKTVWSRADVLAALEGVKVDLAASESWMVNEQKVGGLFFPDENRVLVGPSLAGLCHELGHVVENHLTGSIDYTHAGWQKNGMVAAQAEYASR